MNISPIYFWLYRFEVHVTMLLYHYVNIVGTLLSLMVVSSALLYYLVWERKSLELSVLFGRLYCLPHPSVRCFYPYNTYSVCIKYVVCIVYKSMYLQP